MFYYKQMRPDQSNLNNSNNNSNLYTVNLSPLESKINNNTKWENSAG